jgi:hypothetical protein
MTSLLDLLSGPNSGGILANVAPRLRSDSSSISDLVAGNPLTLMALGAGIAQGGIGRGLQLAVPAMQAEQQRRGQEKSQSAAYHALRLAGIPDGEAMLGALRPEALKAIARFHFDKKPAFGVIGHDDLKQPAYGFIDPASKSVTPYNLQSLGLPANSGEATTTSTSVPSTRASQINDIIDQLGGVLSVTRRMSQAERPSPEAERFQELFRTSMANTMGRALRMTGVPDVEIGEWKKMLNASSSPAQTRAGIARGMEMMSSRLKAPNDTIGGGHQTSQFLSPKSKAILEDLQKWATE